MAESELFAAIAQGLRERSYAVLPMALPAALCASLLAQLAMMRDEQFSPAGIGRQDDHILNSRVRSDEICWINGTSVAGQQWLDWCGRLQRALNEQLLLGLFSFESHFAHYGPGDFYRRHLDAFRGATNRVLSLVAYLNPEWGADDGGELVLYLGEGDDAVCETVVPGLGTLVVFLSEEVPHEVLPAKRDRYSIAGWFRVNGSRMERVDPPR